MFRSSDLNPPSHPGSLKAPIVHVTFQNYNFSIIDIVPNWFSTQGELMLFTCLEIKKCSTSIISIVYILLWKLPHRISVKIGILIFLRCYSFLYLSKCWYFFPAPHIMKVHSWNLFLYLQQSSNSLLLYCDQRTEIHKPFCLQKYLPTWISQLSEKRCVLFCQNWTYFVIHRKAFLLFWYFLAHWISK